MDQLQARKRELETLPEDWYIDMDGSYASLPTQDTIDKACSAAERAMAAGLMVDCVDADANGGTAVDLFNDEGAMVAIYFSNGGHASVVANGWHEAFSETSWPRIEQHLRATNDNERTSG